MADKINRLMRDPNTASSRIYLGNLQDHLTTANVEDHFKKYGTIRGCVLNRNFGFIQFDTEASAEASIKNENGKLFFNRKLIVKQALADKKSGFEPQPMAVGQNLNRTARPGWTRNPNTIPGGGGPPATAVRPSNTVGQPIVELSRDRSPFDDKIRQDDRWAGPPANKFPPISNYPIPHRYSDSGNNDCEIIVVSKILTAYAEAVEIRLKRQGLLVDLLFPNNDVPMGKVLGNIAGRGCLYAILVTPQNLEHRSITVNVLYGEPTEHRNMPVDDAIEFIVRNFIDKQRGGTGQILPTAVPITPAITAPSLSTRHPDAVQTLINMLADNRQLTVVQYDRVIAYLQERRDLQLKVEVGNDPVVVATPTLPPPIVQGPSDIEKERELQKKIFEILNKPSIVEQVPDEEMRPVVDVKESGPKLLADPKVQKALDSLLFDF